jgi:hypothetical protein
MVIVPKHWFFNDWRPWNGGAGNGEMAFHAFKDEFDLRRGASRQARAQ